MAEHRHPPGVDLGLIQQRIEHDLGELHDGVLGRYDVIAFNTCLDTKLDDRQKNAIVAAVRDVAAEAAAQHGRIALVTTPTLPNSRMGLP